MWRSADLPWCDLWQKAEVWKQILPALKATPEENIMRKLAGTQCGKEIWENHTSMKSMDDSSQDTPT